LGIFHVGQLLYWDFNYLGANSGISRPKITHQMNTYFARNDGFWAKLGLLPDYFKFKFKIKA